jgi:hypothetical protein
MIVSLGLLISRDYPVGPLPFGVGCGKRDTKL